MEILITVSFWFAYIFYGKTYLQKYDVSLLRNYTSHLHPLICLQIDFWLMHAPYKMRHMLFCWIACSMYGLGVNMPQALAGNPWYRPIDWRSATFGVTIVLGATIFIIISHSIMVCLSRCKMRCLYKYPKDSVVLTEKCC
jgi:hypothetical protein